MSLTEKQIKARDKSIGLKELLIQALTEQIAASAGYSNHNEAECAINNLEITYTQKQFTLKKLSASLAQAFTQAFPSFVAIQSETDSKTFTLSREAAKKFAGALKGEPAVPVTREQHSKDPGSDSGHGSAASSAASSPQSSPPRKTRGNAANSTAAVLAQATEAAQPGQKKPQRQKESKVTQFANQIAATTPVFVPVPQQSKEDVGASRLRDWNQNGEKIEILPRPKSIPVVNDDHAAVSKRTSARNISFDDATTMQTFLSSLKTESNNTRWDTQGFTFFMRHVPRHIKELRDCLAEVNLADNLQDGQESQWRREIKTVFDRVTKIIEQANKKHPLFRSKTVEKFYQQQKAEINKIKLPALPSQAARLHR